MFDLYPYTNFHELNQDWILRILKKFENELKEAIDYKTIHYADPLQWNITTQYAPNTVVVDENTGIAYISKDAVPSGVLLSDKNYWMVIFDYQKIYNKIMSGVAFNEKDNETASKDLLVNDLVWYHGDLYRITKAISEGSRYVVGTNMVATTIESLLTTYYGRDRIAQLLNDTVNVSGNYTLNARDIAETANRVTIHSKQDTLLDANGKLTEQVTGNREIDVNGSDSVHVDGSSTVNVGGLRSEIYAGDRTVEVRGGYTGKFGSASFETSAPTWLVRFPDKTIDLHDIGKVKTLFVNVLDFGAKGDALYYDNVNFKWYKDKDKTLEPTDDSEAIQNAINYAEENNIHTVYFPDGHYYCKNKSFVINSSKLMFLGENNTELISVGLVSDSFIKITSDITLDQYNYARTPLVNISISGNYFTNTYDFNVNAGVTGISIGYGSSPEQTIISPHICLYNTTIVHFNVGVALLSAYKSGAVNLSIIGCDYGIYSTINDAGNSAINWLVHQIFIEACSCAIFTTSHGFNSLHFIGGAIEYNRVIARSISKLIFTNVRFESDLTASVNDSLAGVAQFTIDDSAQSSLTLDSCLFLYLNNQYSANISYWIPEKMQKKASKVLTDCIIYAPSTTLLGIEKVMISNCNFASNQPLASDYLINCNTNSVTIKGWDTQFDYPYYICAGLNTLNFSAINDNEYIIPVPSDSKTGHLLINGTATSVTIKSVLFNGSNFIDVETIGTETLKGKLVKMFKFNKLGFNYLKLTFSSDKQLTGGVFNTIS